MSLCIDNQYHCFVPTGTPYFTKVELTYKSEGKPRINRVQKQSVFCSKCLRNAEVV